MASFKTRLKVLFGIEKLPNNIEELLEIKKEYEEVMEKNARLERTRDSLWLDYRDWSERVVDGHRRQIDALLEANAVLALNVLRLSKALELSKKIAEDKLDNEQE